MAPFVAALRREKGWTQKELAERLHVTDKAVSKWERRVSMPDTALLIPLAETLGVSVTELLRGERLESDAPLAQREVGNAGGGGGPPLGRGTAAAAGRTAKWKRRWWLCLPLAVLGMAVLLLCAPDPAVFGGVLLVEGLCLGFGAYLCFGIRDVLPAYYDENRITSYSDGIFRMNLAGIALNNRNWPHIIRTCRLWLIGTPVGFPLLCLMLRAFLPPLGWLPLSLIAVLGFFLCRWCMRRKNMNKTAPCFSCSGKYGAVFGVAQDRIMSMPACNVSSSRADRP